MLAEAYRTPFLQVFREHGMEFLHLFRCRRSENANDFCELFETRFAEKNRSQEEHFGENAADRPSIDRSVVSHISEDEFRCSIEARTDVRDVDFAFLQLFCRTEVTQFQAAHRRIDQDVLRLYVSGK